MDKDTKDFLIAAGSIALTGWVLKRLFENKCYYYNLKIIQQQ